uniref:ARAD1C10076p n=1 Tax=Blastobotrys adeninivorans TaxID=409370 RepID=A0A060T608_BLAAD
MARKKTKIQPSPKIVELDSEQDFRNYIGHQEVPKEPLIQQIDRLQNERTTKSYNPADDEDLGAVGRFMFSALDYTAYLVPLLSVFIVLSILVKLQYGDSVDAKEVFHESLFTIVAIAALYAFVHPYRHALLFRIASLAISTAIGCYLIYISNEAGYYLVMSRAPPLGTLWVWLFIEMDWQWSAASLAIVGIWLKIMDYSL